MVYQLQLPWYNNIDYLNYDTVPNIDDNPMNKKDTAIVKFDLFLKKFVST